MDHKFPFPEKYPNPGGSSSSDDGFVFDGSSPPRPMEGLHEAGPPPFLTKTFDMVDDLATNHIVSWSRGGHSFVVWDPIAFSNNILPAYFKHNNFSSFVRQLNTYGFRKIDAEKWEFENEAFVRGRKNMLRSIRRRKTSPQGPPNPPDGACMEVGRFEQEAEVGRLRRDKHALMMELMKLRRQQQRTGEYLRQMEAKLQGTERMQQQMMRFLARAMQNPQVIHQLVQLRDRQEDEATKKRRRPVEVGESSSGSGRGRMIGPVKVEALEFGEWSGTEVSELEALALEMQGQRRRPVKPEEEMEELMMSERELDDGFWEELLSEGFEEEEEEEEEEDVVKKEEEEDVNVLADRLEVLGANPNN